MDSICLVDRPRVVPMCIVLSYLGDVLAIELREEGLDALSIGLNADGREDGGDVLGGGRGVATEAKEKVSGEVLHFEFCRKRERKTMLAKGRFC